MKLDGLESLKNGSAWLLYEVRVYKCIHAYLLLDSQLKLISEIIYYSTIMCLML